MPPVSNGTEAGRGESRRGGGGVLGVRIPAVKRGEKRRTVRFSS